MKLCTVVRHDLSSGAQAAQSCHAALRFAIEHPEVFRLWYEHSNNIVLLSVADEDELELLAQKCEKNNVSVSRFYEPDFDDSLTAIAVSPSGARLVSSLPLALRAKRSQVAA